MNAWMHTCTPVHLSRPFANPAHSLAFSPLSHRARTHIHALPAAYVHSRTRTPTLSCPTHALVMHISPTSLPMPSASAYTCNHGHTPIPAPLCTDSCMPQCNHHRPHVPPPSPSPLWPPSSHMHAITHKYAPSPSCPCPTRPAYIFSLVHTHAPVAFLFGLFSLSFMNHFLCIYNLEY